MNAFAKGLRAFGRTIQHKLGLGFLTPPKPGDYYIIIIDELGVAPGEHRHVSTRWRIGTHRVHWITAGCHYEDGTIWHDWPTDVRMVGYVAIPVK